MAQRAARGTRSQSTPRPQPLFLSSLSPAAGEYEDAVSYFLRSDTPDGLCRDTTGRRVRPPARAIAQLVRAADDGRVWPTGPRGTQLLLKYERIARELDHDRWEHPEDDDQWQRDPHGLWGAMTAPAHMAWELTDMLWRVSRELMELTRRSAYGRPNARYRSPDGDDDRSAGHDDAWERPWWERSGSERGRVPWDDADDDLDDGDDEP